MIRILLVDDHPFARQGIRTVLTDRVKDAVVGEAPDAASAIKQVRNGDWDLMIADISLPGMSGLELIKEVRRIRPTLPTLVLSMHPASQFARRALSAGAIGYLTKAANWRNSSPPSSRPGAGAGTSAATPPICWFAAA
jgi:DNA-binding NarL/FixJ family response regulator